MQIVIDIPEKINSRLRSFLGHGYTLWDEDVKIIADAIYNGQTELEAFEWCTDCKEYDPEKHCCHRWTKVIRQTVEELRTNQPEIIRCGECKHFIRNISCVGGHYNGCDVWLDDGNEIMVAEDGFCNYAERREE